MTPSADDATAPELLQWQCIQTGSLRLAIPYAWTRQIIDQFEVATAPNSPSWLVGATNVESRVVPVIDLADYAGLVQTAYELALPARRRVGLLVGGEGDSSAALHFVGLPSMRQAAALERAAAQALLAQTAPKLAPYAVGFVGPANDGWVGLDATQLIEVLTSEVNEAR
jgi:chemotaxis signal transduction protein